MAVQSLSESRVRHKVSEIKLWRGVGYGVRAIEIR
jgi:hypothetical protein